MTFKVGLTGGVGAGKTVVSDEFARLGVPVIDTDVLARALVEPGQPVLADIARAFDHVLDQSGRLDRARLGERVFADPNQREKLEQILHPAIRREVLKKTQALNSEYCIIVVPLLFEAGFDDLVDRVLLVDLPEQQQIARVMQRDKLDVAQVERIMAAQLDRDSRLARADDVLDNTVSPVERDKAVKQLHLRYLSGKRSLDAASML